MNINNNKEITKYNNSMDKYSDNDAVVDRDRDRDRENISGGSKTKSKDNNKKQKSQMLSSGGYGCVYYPSISCKGSEGVSKNKVTKIQIDDESAKNEIELSNIIRKIPNYSNYFVPVQSSCPIKMTELNRNIIETCDIVNKGKKSFLLMDMKYVKGDNLDEYLLKTENNKYLINLLVSSYTYLLHSLRILIENNIVHYDLKGNNIMYNKQRNIPLIIDFGMSIDLENVDFDNIHFYFFTYAPSYYVWCPEIHIINYLLHIKQTITKKTLREICNEIVKHNKSINTLLNKSELDEYIEDMIEAFTFVIKQDYKTNITTLLQYANTWDNYSLSNIYLKIIQKINPSSSDMKDNHFLHRFSQLLLQNIHPNPEKRHKPNETASKFEHILTTSEKNSYENILISLNENNMSFRKELRESQDYLSVLSETITKHKQ